MAYTIPINNSGVTVKNTSLNLPNTYVVKNGKVLVKKRLQGSVTVTGGNIQNIHLKSYSDASKIPTIQAMILAKAKEQVKTQKYHVAFL